MNEDRLTERLASEILGWRTAPGRFIKPGRGWTPRWNFSPFTKIEDAFLLLDRSGSNYTLTAKSDDGFCAEVRVSERIGTAAGRAHEGSKSRVITLALARALGLEVDS